MSKREVFEAVKANGMLPAFELVAKTFGKLHSAEVRDENNKLIAGYKNETIRANASTNTSARVNCGSNQSDCESALRSGYGRKQSSDAGATARNLYGSRRSSGIN